jgi:hypothetical protein
MSLPILCREMRRSATIAVAVLLAAASAASAEPAAPAEKSEDFYAQRASVLLKNEGVQAEPHPLAESLPESIVVVCEAGCPTGAAQVVYLAPRRDSGPQPVSGAAVSAGLAAECVAGCYAPAEGGAKN